MISFNNYSSTDGYKDEASLHELTQTVSTDKIINSDYFLRINF